MSAELNRPLRVALVNDYQVIVEGLARMLKPFSNRVEIVELVINEAPHRAVDVALYDTFAEREGGAQELVEALAGPNAPRLVFYSWRLRPELAGTVLPGRADGHLSKRLCAGELVDALERVHAGELVVALGNRGATDDPGDWPGREQGLTSREAEIVALITQGLSNDEIAKRVFLSINTVKSYIRTSYRKMGVVSRSNAVLWGVSHGFGIERQKLIRPADAMIGNDGPPESY
jgi:NarL family two-component system response regulator LiaR